MELHLFDFDGTLFKSPEYVPDWWDVPGKYSWFSHPISLTEPCVPLSPSKKWWIENTINDAKHSINDPFAMTIICTGRVKAHKPRVVALLERVGLKSFDGYYFNPNMDAKVFKTDVIEELHGRHGFKSVHIWENENQSYYTRFVERTLGIPCVMHTIDEQHIPYECDASDIRLDHKETPISNEKEILPESQLRVSSHFRNLELRIARLEKESSSPVFELEGHIHEGSEGDYYVRKRGDIKGITSYIESWSNRVLIAEEGDWKIKYDYKHFFGFTASNGLTELELFCVEGECRSEVRQLELLLRKVLLIPRSVRTDFNK